MDTYELHKRLGYKVSRLARLMEARLDSMIGEHGVTRLMWCVLCGVGLEDVRTPSALADYIGIARSAVSRLLRTMETQGLVRRCGSESDGRGVYVELTDLGHEKLAVCRTLVEQLNRHFTTKLSPDDLIRCLETIDRLAEGETTELTQL